MSILKFSKGKRVNCPTCGESVKLTANFCPICGHRLPEDSGQPAMRPLKGHAGLNTWVRGKNEIARHIELRDLRLDIARLRKGLLVGQGTRAVLIKDGQLAEVLGPGNYAVSDRGRSLGVLTRLINHISGIAHCEVYLIDDSEFRISMGEEKNEEELAEYVIQSVFTKLYADEKFKKAIDTLPEEIREEIELIVKSKAQRNLERYGFGERLNYIESALFDLRDLKKDFEVQSKDIDNVQLLLQSRWAKIMRLGDAWISDAVYADDLLRVKTKEGYDVGLGVDIYCKIQGNLEFINNVMHGQADFNKDDLVKKIHAMLQNALQTVVMARPIAELYGNMEIRQRIQSTMLEKLTPTLRDWGLKISRVEGYRWKFGRYEEILKEREDLELHREADIIERTRLENERKQADFKIDMEIAQSGKEIEKAKARQEQQRQQKEHESELELLDAQGEEQVEDLHHTHHVTRDRQRRRQEIISDREERTGQLDTYREYLKFNREKLEYDIHLKETQRESEHRREMERLRFRSDERQRLIDSLQKMSPGQILATFAEQNPELVPALKAYASAEASQKQLSLLQHFQERLLVLLGNNKQRTQAVMDEATKKAGKKILDQIAMKVADQARLTEPSHVPEGSIICHHCQQLVPPPVPKNKICPQCHQLLTEKGF